MKSNTNLARDQRGLSTVEYILLLTLVSIAGITAWEHFGSMMQLKVISLADIIRNLGVSAPQGLI